MSKTAESRATLTSMQASPRAEVQGSSVMESKVAAASSITNSSSPAGGGSSDPVFQNFETLTMTANDTSETNSKILGNTSAVVESVHTPVTSSKSTAMLELLSAARGLLDGTSEASLLALSSASLPVSSSTNLTSPSNLTSHLETPEAFNSSGSTALEIVSLLDPDASLSIPATLGAEVTHPGAVLSPPRSDGAYNRDFVHLVQKLSQQLDMLLGDRALTKPHLVGLTSQPVETSPSLRSEELLGDNLTSSFGLGSGDVGVQKSSDSLSSSTSVNVSVPELGFGGLRPRLLGSITWQDDLLTNTVNQSLPSLVNGVEGTNHQPSQFLNSTNTTSQSDGELLSAKHNISTKEKIPIAPAQPSQLGIGLFGEMDVFGISKNNSNDSVAAQPTLTSFANSIPRFSKDLNSAIDFSGREYLATTPSSKIEADIVVSSASSATGSALSPSSPLTSMSQELGTTEASQTSFAAQRLVNVLTILLQKNPEIFHLIRGLDPDNSSTSAFAHNIPLTSFNTQSKSIYNGTREDSSLSNVYNSSVLAIKREEGNVSVDGVSNTSHTKPVQAQWTDHRSLEIKPTATPGSATAQVFSYPPTPNPFGSTPPPAVTNAQYLAIEEFYHTWSYLKTRDPDVLSRLRTLLQMFALQVKVDPTTLTHLSKEQLLAAGIPVSSAMETMAVSTALHLFAQVYKLSIRQVVDVVSGKRPSQIAQMASGASATPGAGAPQTNAQSADSSLSGSVPPGSLSTSSNSSNSFTMSPLVGAAGSNGTMIPTTTASAMVGEPTEPTEEPEPGDPGFLDFHFKPGSNITHKHVTMLREMMGV
ncbi:nuclear pore complex protein DDB_G0274915-like [Pomacea canaliculata]|uniref:nuclear pore complex protein DDB_G0274915-like n=1 Tax=Pomacea canaliculata TaxID=400727 RepID=UPI000D72C168|nr:nuclear pore complex protein DDB_G0274915-like [Pomacea canaliculata]